MFDWTLNMFPYYYWQQSFIHRNDRPQVLLKIALLKNFVRFTEVECNAKMLKFQDQPATLLKIGLLWIKFSCELYKTFKSRFLYLTSKHLCPLCGNMGTVNESPIIVFRYLLYNFTFFFLLFRYFRSLDIWIKSQFQWFHVLKFFLRFGKKSQEKQNACP